MSILPLFSPLSFIRGGAYYVSSLALSGYGIYWETKAANIADAYDQYFSYDGRFGSWDRFPKGHGFSLRCIVR